MALHEEQLPAVQGDVVPAFAIPLEEAKKRIAELQSFVKSQMVKDVDYGTIPGTEKPTLLKPGAEKLAMMYGFSISVEVSNRLENWEQGFFSYEATCKLTNKRTGIVEAVGVGSCNSMEARYRWRWMFDNEIPSNVDTSLLTKKEGTSKNGRNWVKYRVENDDPYSYVNTFLKMAKKRAVVDAVLSATRSSGLFTQDLEDLPLRSASPASGRGPKMATKETVKELSEAAKEYGISERKDLYAWLDDQLGTHNPKQITEEDARRLIDELRAGLDEEPPFIGPEEEGGAE